MFDITHLLISAAQAQDAAPPVESSTAALMNYLPFIAIFAVFYFLVIQPQQKKLTAQEKMIKALQRGDRVVFAGGVLGKITKIEGDDMIFVEIAQGVEIKMSRNAIQSLEAKPQPVIDTVTDKK